MGIPQELQNKRQLEKRTHKSLSSGYIVEIFDAFAHTGPNEIHECIVFELLRPTVAKVLEDYQLDHDCLNPEMIFQMSVKLLQTLTYIHSAGMCHGGGLSLFSAVFHVVGSNNTHVCLDVNCRNISHTCTHLSNATEKQPFDVLGPPEVESLARIDGTPLENGLPTQLVRAAECEDWVDEDEEEIRLLDFERASSNTAQRPLVVVYASIGAIELPYILCCTPFYFIHDHSNPVLRTCARSVSRLLLLAKSTVMCREWVPSDLPEDFYTWRGRSFDRSV